MALEEELGGGCVEGGERRRKGRGGKILMNGAVRRGGEGGDGWSTN